jgi:predicted lipoprotein with Yx(FWY)xxD motif
LAPRRCWHWCHAAWRFFQHPLQRQQPGGRRQQPSRQQRRDDREDTFDGHPLYTYVGDTSPGQANGNGLNSSGGLWHEVTTPGSAAPAGASSPASGAGNGY